MSDAKAMPAAPKEKFEVDQLRNAENLQKQAELASIRKALTEAAKAAGEKDEESFLEVSDMLIFKDNGGAFAQMCKGLLGGKETKMGVIEMVAASLRQKAVTHVNTPSMKLEHWRALGSSIRGSRSGIPSVIIRAAMPRLTLMAVSANGFDFDNQLHCVYFVPGNFESALAGMPHLEIPDEAGDGEEAKARDNVNMKHHFTTLAIMAKCYEVSASAAQNFKTPKLDSPIRYPQKPEIRFQQAVATTKKVSSMKGHPNWQIEFEKWVCDQAVGFIKHEDIVSHWRTVLAQMKSRYDGEMATLFVRLQKGAK